MLSFNIFFIEEAIWIYKGQFFDKYNGKHGSWHTKYNNLDSLRVVEQSLDNLQEVVQILDNLQEVVQSLDNLQEEVQILDSLR